MGKSIFKLKTIVLAGALTAAAAIPAFAEDPQGDYIIFLPVKEGVEYEADDSHVSDEYSTERYTVLLYKPGDIVSFQVNSGSPFAIEEAVSGNVFDGVSIAPNGIVSFSMPALDLCVDPAWEGDTETPGVWAGESNLKGEPGTFTVVVGAGMHGSASMVDGNYIKMDASTPLVASSNVDIIYITSDDYLDSEPVTKVFKNGGLMEDQSAVIINSGVSDHLYTVDFSNQLQIGEDAYVVEIGDVAAQDTAGTETDAAQEGTDPAQASDASGTADGTVNAYFPQESDTEAAAEPYVDPATQADTEPYVDPATQADTEPYVDPATQADTEPYVDPATQADTEPYVDPATQADTEAYVDPAAQAVEDPYVDPSVDSGTAQETASDGEASVDMALSSTMSTFADTVRDAAPPVTITVTTKVPEIPVIVKMADGTVETAAGSFIAEKEVEEIEFIGSMAYAPQIKVLKDGEELEEDDIILEKMYLENGHLYFKVAPWDEIEAGDYEIQIG